MLRWPGAGIGRDITLRTGGPPPGMAGVFGSTAEHATLGSCPLPRSVRGGRLRRVHARSKALVAMPLRRRLEELGAASRLARSGEVGLRLEKHAGGCLDTSPQSASLPLVTFPENTRIMAKRVLLSPLRSASGCTFASASEDTLVLTHPSRHHRIVPHSVGPQSGAWALRIRSRPSGRRPSGIDAQARDRESSCRVWE
jgi:hypothetical protein